MFFRFSICSGVEELILPFFLEARTNEDKNLFAFVRIFLFVLRSRLIAFINFYARSIGRIL